MPGADRVTFEWTPEQFTSAIMARGANDTNYRLLWLREYIAYLISGRFTFHTPSAQNFIASKRLAGENAEKWGEVDILRVAVKAETLNVILGDAKLPRYPLSPLHPLMLEDAEIAAWIRGADDMDTQDLEDSGYSPVPAGYVQGQRLCVATRLGEYFGHALSLGVGMVNAYMALLPEAELSALEDMFRPRWLCIVENINYAMFKADIPMPRYYMVSDDPLRKMMRDIIEPVMFYLTTLVDSKGDPMKSNFDLLPHLFGLFGHPDAHLAFARHNDLWTRAKQMYVEWLQPM